MKNQSKHGGARPGAGRPHSSEKKQVKAFSLSPWALDFVNQYSKEKGLSQSSAIEEIINFAFMKGI